MKKYWIDGPIVESSLYDHVVKERSISNIEQFIAPQWPNDLHDPLLLPDCAQAVARIWRAIENQEKIGIVGDYDMDGTPAAALLYDFLRQINYTPIVILPTRSEGYGFSESFVERFKKQGVSCIITVDTGIRDTSAVTLAASYGIDVIITDHHECGEVMPQAFAIVNPKRPDSAYPFRELCGTGIVFKLCQALADNAPEAYRSKLGSNWFVWSLDLVALATVGDMVPLLDENRLFVTYGLKVLQKTKRVGLYHLMEALELMPEMVTYRDIAYKIIPKLNASGRMENMDDVFTLLTSWSKPETDAALKRILTRGTQSQIILANMMEEARMLSQQVLHAPVIVLARDHWHPGLTGIVAGRLAEEYKRPVGIFAGVEETVYRGSMRSIPGVQLPDVLNQASEFIDRFGGHEQAAGLSFQKHKLEPLTQALGHLIEQKIMASTKQTSGTITPSHVDLDSLHHLSQLAPWGVGNEEPTWSLCDVSLYDIRWLKDGAHLKALVRDNNRVLPLIFFGAQGAKEYVDKRLDIYGTLAINEFKGMQQPQFMVKDICLHADS